MTFLSHFDVLVDEQDRHLLDRWSWSLNSKGYVHRRTKQDGKPKTIFLHRLITNAPAGLEVDHINQDKLDNRRCNLRIVTRSQNHLNRKLSSRNKSGCPGVRFRNGKWQVDARRERKRLVLGRFADKQEAINCKLAWLREQFVEAR